MSWTHRTPVESGRLHHHSYPHHHPETKILPGGKKQGSHQCAPFLMVGWKMWGDKKSGLSRQRPQNREHIMTPNEFPKMTWLFVFVLNFWFSPWPTSPSYSGQRSRSARGSQCPITGAKGISWSIFRVLKPWFYKNSLKTQLVETFWLYNSCPSWIPSAVCGVSRIL